MGQPSRVEAGSLGGESIHTRWNKGDRSLLNTPQGSGRQNSKEETVCHEAVVGGCS